jgi:hypothetical protein
MPSSLECAKMKGSQTEVPPSLVEGAPPVATVEMYSNVSLRDISTRG